MTATPGARPQLAVSAVIFRDDQLLLVRRAREPGRGLYSVPGGRVEHGETLHEAVAREVREETSIGIDIVGFAGWREVLPDLAAGRAGHYLVISFAARWRDGDVVLNDELDEFRWLDASSFENLTASRTLRTTQGLRGIVGAARKLIEV